METTLLGLAVLVFLYLRAEKVLGSVLMTRADIERRKLELEERKLVVEERRSPNSLEPEELPVDLQMRVAHETEPWAQEQVRSLIRQLYNEHKTWDAVRQALSHLDESTETRPAGWSQTVVTP